MTLCSLCLFRLDDNDIVSFVLAVHDYIIIVMLITLLILIAML